MGTGFRKFEDYKEWKKDHPNYTNRSEEMIEANFRGKLKELDERRQEPYIKDNGEEVEH